MQHIWACNCGIETICTPADTRIGAVFQCPGCKTIWGGVNAKRGGGPYWVPIDPKLAEFHRLLQEPEEE